MSDPTPPNDGSLGARFTDFLIGHPFLSVLVALLMLGAAMPGMGKIQADFTHRGFFYADDPLLLQFDDFERRFGNDDAVVLIVHSPSGIFDQESIALLSEITDQMWLVPEVIRVQSLTNFQWVHAVEDDIEVEPLIPDDIEVTDAIIAERKKVALTHEAIPDYLVNKAGDTAVVFGYIKPGIDAPPDTPMIVGAVRDLTQKFQTDGKGGDHEFHITGGPAINLAFKESTQGDMQRLLLIIIGLIILFLALSFRTVGGVLLPLLVVVTSVMATMAMAGWLGVKITNLTATLPQIMIAIGIADSVHILHSFFAARRRGDEKRAAARYALTKNFIPTVLTSVSTAMGFFSFSTANIISIAGLGVLAGIGTIFAWLVTYLLMAPIMSRLPMRVRQDDSIPPQDQPSERSVRATAFIFKNRFAIVGVYAVATAIFFAAAASNEVNSDPFLYFKEGFPLRTANDFVENKLGGAQGVEMVIDSGEKEGIKDPAFLKKVETFQAWLDEYDGVTKTVSILDVLKQTNRSLNGGKDEAYVLPESKEAIAQQLFLYTMSLPQGMDVNDRITIENDAIRLTAMWTIHDSTTAIDTVEIFENKAKELGLTAHATGKVLLYQRMNGHVVYSFVTSLSIAFVLISLLLVVFLRSFRLGMLALLPNIIPVLFGGFVLKLVGKEVDVGTVVISSICLGIAVDDTIHFITNYRKHLGQGLSPDRAVALVLTHTMPALLVTTIVLVSAFGTFAFATFIPNLYMGVMTAIVLGMALFTDVTFLPAILMLRQKEPAAEPSAEVQTAT